MIDDEIGHIDTAPQSLERRFISHAIDEDRGFHELAVRIDYSAALLNYLNVIAGCLPSSTNGRCHSNLYERVRKHIRYKLDGRVER